MFVRLFAWGDIFCEKLNILALSNGCRAFNIGKEIIRYLSFKDNSRYLLFTFTMAETKVNII